MTDQALAPAPAGTMDAGPAPTEITGPADKPTLSPTEAGRILNAARLARRTEQQAAPVAEWDQEIQEELFLDDAAGLDDLDGLDSDDEDEDYVEGESGEEVDDDEDDAAP